MATAYSPGLKVSRSAHIRKLRRLPLTGEVLVESGRAVEPDDVLARAELPGIMRTVRAAELLGVEPNDLGKHLQVKEGDTVQKGDILCRSTSFFGLFKNECRTPVSGLIELINPISGNIGIREAPSPVEITAYIHGIVTEVIPNEGAVVETDGAFVQGIFGIGGEKHGPVRMVATDPSQTLSADGIPEDVEGQVLIGGACADLSALQAAASRGAAAIVVGGVVDSDIVSYLGFDIGVAITGQEPVVTTVILTEGFGGLQMAARTWELLSSLEGQKASVNGATQIRAGVIRPEVIVPGVSSGATVAADAAGALEIGSAVRLIRDPWFGQIGRVVELPTELQPVPSGAMVRVLVAEIAGGERVTAPRANVELIQQ
jgi:hypothetical protein